ncbi:hypothetical protein ABVC71_06620 [Prevotella amnii]|uniref:hypothetical protein n=1 Tax=Prevotella amnii TaxID=419005 RepID=UPI00336A486F
MDNNKSTVRRPNHRLRPMRERGRFFITRQWLNSIFMLGALIGGIFYFATDDTNVGIIIILIAMVFKIIECILRFIK